MTERRYFILVGDKETWLISFNQNTWGFSNRTKGNWNTSNIGDYVAFYVTKPVKKIIGFGIIISKFVSDDLLFPDEKLFSKSIWKYGIEFKKILTVKKWEEGVPISDDLMLNTGRKVVDKKTFSALIKTTLDDRTYNITIYYGNNIPQ